MGTAKEGVVPAKGIKNIFNKIIAKTFPNLEKEMAVWIYKVCRPPNKKIRKPPLQDIL
jgi:hypothetical protein